MSQLYGVVAGLLVCLSSWAATTYISMLAGVLVGLFLLTFFTVSAIYLSGDELIERQKAATKALTDMEVIVFERLKDLDRKVSRLETAANGSHSRVEELETLLAMVDEILTANDLPPSNAPYDRQQLLTS
jgi:cell division protein FtsL